MNRTVPARSIKPYRAELEKIRATGPARHGTARPMMGPYRHDMAHMGLGRASSDKAIRPLGALPLRLPTISSGPVLPISSTFQRSISPSGRFPSANGGGVAASSTFFDHRRPSSPTRVNLIGVSPSPVPSVHFSLDNHRHHPTSPSHSLAVADHLSSRTIGSPAPHRWTCMCSPTTHPGSFRCSLHKGLQLHHNHSAVSSPSNRLNARRSAMANSLVRIGTVEGEWVKRALTALIRPSSHQQRRRAAFQPRPSRLSVMSKADDL